MTHFEETFLKQLEEMSPEQKKQIADALKEYQEDRHEEILKTWYVKVLTLASQMWWETPPNDVCRAYEKMSQKYPNIYEMILTEISVKRRNRIMVKLREQYYNTGT